MKSTSVLTYLFVTALGVHGQSVQSQQQATVTGAPGPGHCVIEVEVDGTVELALRDRQATARTLVGRPAILRHFECNQPLPRNPDGFQIQGNRGRGQVRLMQDPSRDGLAVVRIDDPKSGSDIYVFTLAWRENGVSAQNGGYPNGDQTNGHAGDSNQQDRGRDGDQRSDRDRGRDGDQRPDGDRGRDGDHERYERRQQLVKRCADAVQERLTRDEYQDVQITAVNVEDRPGRRGDRVLGRAAARSRWGVESFGFACGVSFEDGSIRGVDVVPQ